MTVSLLVQLLVLALILLFYNEFLIFYISVRQCSWSCHGERCLNELKIFIISDTHLLGRMKGHWLDKLKREWQMRQSYQRAVAAHQPDVVFFLGDVLDEGQWASEGLFREYADEFRSLFETTNERGPMVYALPGNHDVGFHYVLSPYVLENFEKQFNRTLVDEIYIKGSRFILINSMALHGDGCSLCHEAEEKIDDLSSSSDKRPILLQHFPLHRTSDAECEKFDDYHEIDESEIYRDKWDTLSKSATKNIIEKLKPLAVFNGHTHKMCKKRWSINSTENFYEYTVNSFSWRNGDLPAFLMITLAEDEQPLVESCRLPSEKTQLTVYLYSGIMFVLFWILKLINSSFGNHKLITHTILPSYSSGLLKND